MSAAAGICIGGEPIVDVEKYHEPVLLREVLELLRPAPGRLFVDGTLGGGGHARAFLDAGALVIGLDQDPEAIRHATAGLSGYGERFQPVRANFSEAGAVLDEHGIGRIDGALLDIGVSSHQLDEPERGFSFAKDGPLDMRMDPDGPVTAADIVNESDEAELIRIFREFGEEPAARRVAAQIARERIERPFSRTLELADAVAAVVPKRGRLHPATRIFQALRIAVNRELEVLERGLDEFGARLAPGGRLGVITFHSLEDRLVKNEFKRRSVEWLDRPEWPAPRRNPDCIFKLITRKPVVAGEEEQKRNPRSRSAKLRVVERKFNGKKS